MFFLGFIMKILPIKDCNVEGFVKLIFVGNPGVIASLLRILISGVTDCPVLQSELLEYLINASPDNKAILALIMIDGKEFHPHFQLSGFPISMQNCIRLTHGLYNTWFHLEESVTLKIVYPDEFVLSFLAVVQEELQQKFLFKDCVAADSSEIRMVNAKLEIQGERISTVTQVILSGEMNQISDILHCLQYDSSTM